MGRKGCEVIINKDKGVSRVHAEIVVNAMSSLNPQQSKSSNMFSEVCIIDCSKYGTFIKRNFESSKERVHELPNKETILKDGDLVSFGTGNATYRFSFVPLIFFAYCLEPFQVPAPLRERISLIGSCITHTLSSECTHLLVNQSMPVKEDLIDAILAKKPLVLKDWIEVVAEKNIQNDIPSYTFYLPTLTFEGVSVNIADPKSRGNCLGGYTFLLNLAYKYKFGNKLQILLELGGAKVVHVQEFSPSQGFEDGESDLVHVIPMGPSYKIDNTLTSLPIIKDVHLISAILSGHLDPSLMISPPRSTSGGKSVVPISSSTSTDETVVADSDVEVESTVSIQRTAAFHKEEINSPINANLYASIKSGTGGITCLSDKNDSLTAMKDEELENKKPDVIYSHDLTKLQVNANIYTDHAASKSETDGITCFRDKNDSVTTVKDDELENKNSDIIYSQYLIVRNVPLPASLCSTTNKQVINFKAFRKAMTQSGNSFHNLIPFSRYPYKDGDCENEEVAESMKEEKKRKQMERIAEDLFNTEKGRRRGAAGSMREIFARR